MTGIVFDSSLFMPANTPSPKKKPLLSRKAKRIVFFFGLLLALPVVIAGALTPQNLHQEAATDNEKPNILLIQVDNQRADTLSLMQSVKSRLQTRGMTFTQAVALKPWHESSLSAVLDQSGYTTKTVGPASVAEVGKQAAALIRSTHRPYLLNVRFTAMAEDAAQGACDRTVSAGNPAVNEANVSDKPRAVRLLPTLSPQQLKMLQTSESEHLCQLQAIDQAVAAILDTLGEEQQQTIIVYTAQAGYAWGEHRLRGAACAYDACRHVPLVLSYPAMFRTALTSRQLVQPADLTATLLQLVGRSDAFPARSVSLVPLFTRPEVPVHQAIAFTATDPAAIVGVRTKEFLYLEYADGEKEFYDLVADPLELTNQIQNTAYASAITTLAAEVKH